MNDQREHDGSGKHSLVTNQVFFHTLSIGMSSLQYRGHMVPRKK